MRFNRGDDIADAAHDRREVNDGHAALNAKTGRVRNLMCNLCAFDEGLGWDTSGVEAIAAHVMRFDQGHFRFDHCRDVGRHQARRSGTNDYQVAVKPLRLLPMFSHGCASPQLR